MINLLHVSAITAGSSNGVTNTTRMVIECRRNLLLLIYALINALLERTVDLKLNVVPFSDSVLRPLFSSL
jgi:hypothetical protein